MESTAATTPKLLSFGDYVVIGAMVLVSTSVGLYYGINKKKHSSPFEYFLAGRSMTLIPVAFSAFATGMGPSTLLGMSTESYNFGMQIAWWCIMEILVAFIMSWIFIPLYYRMGSMNVYKFLEVRYNRMTKDVVTVVSGFQMIFTCSNGVYGTAMAFSQVTNINHWFITGSMIGLCILYTSVGGMKGVMWADVIQAIMMMWSTLTIVVLGLIYVGGVEVVWQRSYESGRLDMFDFNTDPTVRHTFWTSTLGYFFFCLVNRSTSQIIQQRYLTAPTIKEAKRGNMLQLAIYVTALFLAQTIGIIMYAKYYSCDPMESKRIRNLNQLASVFIMDSIGEYQILPGIFFAGLLAAILSTLSSVFNSVPAIFYESLVKPLKPNMSARQADIICKLLCIIIGISNMAMILITKNFPNMKQGSMSISSMLSGSLMVIIFFGLLFPQANFKAAFVSFVSGILVCLWIVIGGLLVKHPLKPKPLSNEGCLVINSTTFTTESTFSFGLAMNVTEMKTSESPWAEYFPLYSISYIWISLIGVIVSSVVFIITSQIFEKEPGKLAVVDVIPEAVQNFHRGLSKTWRKILLCDVYDNEKEKLPEQTENLQISDRLSRL